MTEGFGTDASDLVIAGLREFSSSGSCDWFGHMLDFSIATVATIVIVVIIRLRKLFFQVAI